MVLNTRKNNMHDLYIEDQIQFYKDKITHQKQLRKAIEIEDRKRWAESPNLETPSMKVEKVKSSWSIVSLIKALRV